MIRYMIDATGRKRVADLVRAQMGWYRLSGPGIEATGRVSRATIDRVKKGDPKVSDTMLRALGDALGLPRDFLIYVGSGDVRQIEASGGDPDLVRWTLDLVNESQRNDPPDASAGTAAGAMGPRKD